MPRWRLSLYIASPWYSWQYYPDFTHVACWRGHYCVRQLRIIVNVCTEALDKWNWWTDGMGNSWYRNASTL